MTTDIDALVKRLTDKCEREFTYDSDCDEAAAAIRALQARVAELEAALPSAYEMGRDDAANVDWFGGSEVADTAPSFLSDWQRGFVSGQSAITVFIRALTPPADLAAKLGVAE